MIKKRYVTLALATALALSPLAVLRAASLIGHSYGSGADADVEANVGTSINIDNRSSTALSGSTMTVTRNDLDTEVDTSSRARVGIPNTGKENEASSTASSTAAMHADENAFIHANEHSAIFRADDVATQDDLKAYSLEALRADENLSSMSFGNDSIVVGYKDHGRFVDLIPVVMSVNVIVDGSGNVSFDYPWYSFLVVKDRADLETRIRNEISGVASSTAGWTNYDRAVLAERILAALKAHFDATTSSTTAI